MISELPHSQPQITGGGDLKNVNYKPGDLLNLTCTSAPSNPPAKLEWILNDEPVSYEPCQNFRIFLPLRFYMKSKLANVEPQKVPF